MDRLNQYRQPLVTATGIFLGFMLNYIGGWLPEAFSQHLVRDLIVATGTLISFASLLLVLTRILRMKIHANPERFYRRTLILFLVGIGIPFLTFLLVIIRKLVQNWDQLRG
jgi:hypothetical protein